MSDVQNSRAVLAALKGLQDKIRFLEDERTRSVEDALALKGELARRQEEFKYSQQLQDLTIQEQNAAARLSYERLLADKKAVDVRLHETGELQRDFKGKCETARERAQNAQVAQLAAEAKVSVLERRVEECEQMAKVRKDRCLQARKAIDRETGAADAELVTLTVRLKALQRTLCEERAARTVVQNNCRRAETINYRTSRYLDSILRVNQELVATRTRPSKPRPPQRRSVPARELGKTCSRRRRKAVRKRPTSSRLRVDGGNGGFDVVPAVAEAFRVGRAGGNPIPTLEALYERIGFCALQEEHGPDGVTSLPTSPSKVRPNSASPEARSRRDRRAGEGYSSGNRPGFVPPTAFFPRDRYDGLSSPEAVIPARRTESRRSGRGNGGGGRGTSASNSVAKGGYSFAHSPRAVPTSVAERSPRVVRRLETLASQLERERSDVERWYKTMVHGATPGAGDGGKDIALDANGLTTAIACLQEKAQQLEVVRESLEAFNHPPPTTPVHSPTACRRKAAALNVLQGLCEDVGEDAGVVQAA